MKAFNDLADFSNEELGALIRDPQSGPGFLSSLRSLVMNYKVTYVTASHRALFELPIAA